MLFKTALWFYNYIQVFKEHIFGWKKKEKYVLFGWIFVDNFFSCIVQLLVLIGSLFKSIADEFAYLTREQSVMGGYFGI